MDSLDGDSRAYMANSQNDSSLVVKSQIVEEKSIPSNSKEWKRAIPEVGYITLGTIRYGVKLSQRCLSSNCTHFRSSSLSTTEHFPKGNSMRNSSRNSTSNTQSQSIEHDIGSTNTNTTNGLTKNTECSSSLPNVCDSDNSLSEPDSSVNGSCCLNTTKCSLPWINKADNAKTLDLSKNRIEVGLSNRSLPTETICASVDQQPFSNYETNKISDKSSYVNPTSVKAYVDDFSDVEKSRILFSTPIFYHISTNNNQIDNNRKSITSSAEQKQSVYYLDVISRNQNKRKTHRTSPTHFHPIECECSALRPTNSSENPTFTSCHIENRKIIKVGHKFSNSNDVIHSISNPSWIVDANHANNKVCANEFQVNKPKFHCLDYEHSDRCCCFCCYSDCKKESKSKSIYKCDDQTVDRLQLQVNPSNLCYSGNDTNLHTHLNNNCKFYQNQNHDPSSFCKSTTPINTDIFSNCLVHDSSFHSSQFHNDPNTLTKSVRHSNEKCAKFNKRKTDSLSSKHLRRSHSINENCSDCIGQLDKQFIKQIKRLQSADVCAKNQQTFTETAPCAKEDEKKLVCCSKHVTAVRKTATLFLIGSDGSTLVGSKPKIYDKSELVRDGFVDTCQNLKNTNNNYDINIDRNCELDKSIDNNNLLTSILPQKESHSKRLDRNQIINYKIRSHRTTHQHLKSDCDENRHLYPVKKEQHETFCCENGNDKSNGNEKSNDNDNDNENLCHLEKLNLADSGSATSEQVEQKVPNILSTYRKYNDDYDDGATTTQTTAAPSLAVENELFAVDKSKQNEHRVNSVECTDQSAIAAFNNQAKITCELNQNTVTTNHQTSESKRNSSTSDNENTDYFTSEKLLHDKNTNLTNRDNVTNDECILFEHKPIPPVSENCNRLLNTPNMEKRFNTLDRWQRLRFGRRAASNPPEDKKPSNLDIDLSGKRSSDKLERLREITELLKVSRNPAPNSPSNETTSNYEIPPVPPPRKPRTSLGTSGSVEKFIDTSASESGSPTMNSKFDHSINDKSENSRINSTSVGQSTFHVPTAKHSLIETLRPNTSVANLDHIYRTRDKDKTIMPLEEESNRLKVSKKIPSSNQETPSVAQRESCPPINIHPQKAIPFRSASFSQVDYSSGKYIRSALGALKASLSKAKSPPISISCKKDRSGSSTPEDTKLNECTDIWIPLKGPCDKRKDLNLDLIDASATANMILEEDSEHSPISNKSESFSSPLPYKTLNAAQVTVDSPYDEGVAIQNVDNSFRSATLIPTPVYEHASGKIAPSDDPNKTDDIPVFSEICSDQKKSNENLHGESMKNHSHKHGKLNRKTANTLKLNPHKFRNKTQSPTLEIELPAIAVTPGSSVSGSSFEEMDNSSSTQPPNRSEFGSDYAVEVRKRYSNEDKSSNDNRSDDSNHSPSTSGTNSPKSHHHHDEKRRIDKSKRRKGMYIQWATLDKHNKELNAVSWTVGGDSSHELCDKIVPELDANGQPVWPISTYRSDNSLQIDGSDKLRKIDLQSMSSIEATSPDVGGKGAYMSHDDNPTSASCDLFTPDSECERPPVWPQRGTLHSRRQSLSLQSSEEKDESQSLASSPPTTSKPHSKIFVLRSDSISDNEMSDRTPPPRDRTSQSPAPDHDLKRYSKRPLRGPYGQMLEAEMKKPAKQNYDGLLEELNRSESPYMLSAKQRDSNLLYNDDIVPPYTQRSISMGKSSTSRKSSEIDNSLPIPVHTRAASTPAHMETQRNEAVHSHHHRRYPSCVETSPRKETKKFSADNYIRSSDDRHNKRAMSESKEKMTKRNVSSPAAIALLSTANEKMHRSDDRGKSPIKQHTLPIKATPELLAQLLAGSSEKMTTAERE